MQLFKAISNSNIYDVCLNTYGTLDLLVKLLVDNNFGTVNNYPQNEQEFSYDETLILQATSPKIKYATKQKKIFYPPNPTEMSTYEQTLEAEYTALVDGETVITLLDLQGASRIIQIENEVKPMFVADYSFNSTDGRINLLNGKTVDAGKSLFILYVKIVTV